MTDTLLERADDEDSSEETRDTLEAKKAEHAGILAQLKAEHRFVRAWDIAGFGLLVCRRMRRLELQTFTKKTSAAGKKFELDGDPNALMDTNESVVKTLCVWPKDRETLKQLFDEYPSFSSAAALELSKLGEEGITDLGKE